MKGESQEQDKKYIQKRKIKRRRIRSGERCTSTSATEKNDVSYLAASARGRVCVCILHMRLAPGVTPGWGCVWFECMWYSGYRFRLYREAFRRGVVFSCFVLPLGVREVKLQGVRSKGHMMHTWQEERRKKNRRTRAPHAPAEQGMGHGASHTSARSCSLSLLFVYFPLLIVPSAAT